MTKIIGQQKYFYQNHDKKFHIKDGQGMQKHRKFKILIFSMRHNMRTYKKL